MKTYKIYLTDGNFYRSDAYDYWENKEYDKLPLIGEIKVSEDYLIHTLIEKNGCYFSIVCHTTCEPFVARAELVNIISFNEKETLYENNPVCPICGAEQQDSYEFEDIQEHNCDDCGALLRIDRDIEVTYSTTVLKKPKIKKIKSNLIEVEDE